MDAESKAIARECAAIITMLCKRLEKLGQQPVVSLARNGQGLWKVVFGTYTNLVGDTEYAELGDALEAQESRIDSARNRRIEELEAELVRLRGGL